MDETRNVASRFKIEEIIGKGQFSLGVYRAKDLYSGRRVALKKIHISSMFSPEARADCLKETALLQQLDHPNIIRYISSFIDKNELNIVLELADDGDLSKLIRTFRRCYRLIPEPTIWRYFVQIASGLDHMHSKRIMHRDIKPANVFVTRGGVVKLGDLGMGRFFSAATYEARTLAGTPYYMSPERLQEKGYSFPSDIWSMGCLLYELAALCSPFYQARLNLYALTKKIESSRYPPVPSNIYSSRLRQLVDACLGSDPDSRPSASDILMFSLAEHKRHCPPPHVSTSTPKYWSHK